VIVAESFKYSSLFFWRNQHYNGRNANYFKIFLKSETTNRLANGRFANRLKARQTEHESGRPGRKLLMEIFNKTRFSAFTPFQALAALFLLNGAIAWCLVQGEELPGLDLRDLRSGLSDSILYERVSNRVRSGENYYEAASVELKGRGYQHGSLFHWRMPIYAWIFGGLRSQMLARVFLTVGAIVGLVMTSTLIGRESGRVPGIMAAITLLVTYGAWFIQPEPAYFMELWSSVALLISLSFYSQGRSWWAILAGGLALGLRELALPYCTLWCAMAFMGGRRREVMVWFVVIAGFFIMLLCHYINVKKVSYNTFASNSFDWITFDGTHFILSCSRMAYPLMALPAWCTAVYLPMALLGLYSWRSQAARPFQISTIIYIIIFSIIGKQFNYYWGWIFAPWLAIGAAWSPFALCDLIAAIRRGLYKESI
jgi:hypothetical protein